MDNVRIRSDVYQTLCETVGNALPEAGAVIGWDGRSVTKVWFDEPAGYGKALYRPSRSDVERIVNEWIRKGSRFAGIVHSHVEQYPQLSPMDLRSAIWIMEENNLAYMLMGLFCKGNLTMYALKRRQTGGKPELTKLEIIIVW